MQHKFFRLAVCASLTGMIATSMAHAEGSTREPGDGVNFGAGNHGVNRVIRSKSGYTSVEGNIQISYSMPTNKIGLYETSAGSGVLDAVAPIKNGPSAYLGGIFTSARAARSTQVDAGLQFYPTTYSFTAQQLQQFPSTRSSAPAGWGIFFYLDPVVADDYNGNPINMRLEISPRTLDPQHVGDVRGMPYRAPAGAISGLMNFTASQTGAAIFTFAPLGTIAASLPQATLTGNSHDRWEVDQNHPVAPWMDNAHQALVVFDPTAYGAANVKRVVAMTRFNPTSELDGSQVVAQWSECRVQPNGAALRTWNEPDVDQLHTGYDAPRLGSLAYDKRYNGQPVHDISHPIVESNFAPLDTSNARYMGEIVTINLGMIARPVGSAVK